MFDFGFTAVDEDELEAVKALKSSKEEVVKIADGRVYTGKQSKELGLIDVIGTFEDAILIAGTMGQITGKPKTVQVNKKRPSVLDWFTGNLGQTVSGWFDKLPAYRWRME